MAEVKDPAIKLFGRTIPLLSGGENMAVSGEQTGGEDEKELSEKDATPESEDKGQESPSSEEKGEAPASSTESDIPKPSSNEDTPHVKDSKAGEQQKTAASNSQEKQPLKKPDKILPCPRCNSLETKFCYYNNYNVNQPRHFCKNCQRYWTAGGTMRNVPVGAGRRKNKHSTRHATMPVAVLQSLPHDASDTIHHLPMKPNGTVLSFGPDMPLCESMASVLNLAEKKMKNCNGNGLQQMENGDDHSSGSSVTASSSNDEGVGVNSQEPVMRNFQAFPPTVPCYNGTSPWPYPWTPPPPPPFCTPSFPLPFYPAVAYWGCAVPSSFSMPWMAPLASPTNGCSSPASSGSGSNSPTLGKHSREGIMLKNSNSENGGDAPKKINQEGGIWVPKILRIDDPEEAAKSSIWASIGIKNDKSDGSGLFKAFQTKAEKKEQMSEAAEVLHANPAALLRSLNFQES